MPNAPHSIYFNGVGIIVLDFFIEPLVVETCVLSTHKNGSNYPLTNAEKVDNNG